MDKQSEQQIIVSKKVDKKVVELTNKDNTLEQIHTETGLPIPKIIAIRQAYGLGIHYKTTRTIKSIKSQNFLEELQGIRNIMIDRHMEMKKSGDKFELDVGELCIQLMKLIEKVNK